MSALAGLLASTLAVLAAVFNPPSVSDTAFFDHELRRMLGQMVMVGFRGYSVGPGSQVVQQILHNNLGGVILFDYDAGKGVFERNISSPEQVRKLVSDLKSWSTTPLFVGIDQEGGRINRLKPQYGFAVADSQYIIGLSNSRVFTESNATVIASALRDCGFNLNFSPVADLNVNTNNPVIGMLERSFSGNPAVVTSNAGYMIDVYHRFGIISCLKHYPGHGSSEADSHQGFVDVTASYSSAELEPYKSLVGSGRADMIMTAHIYNAAYDTNYPATLSYGTITTLLRQKLGYNGVTISDDLQMGAITSKYTLEQSALLAIEAGADILLFGNQFYYDDRIAVKVIDILFKNVKNGRLPFSRIRESYKRILKLKAHYLFF